MTQRSRTTETINRDNAAIREIMQQIRELTVPDRATLAVGLLGHLATLMNRSQMAKLMAELQEEVVRVQDVPPARQRDADEAGERHDDARPDARSGGTRARGTHAGVGQAGRGEFRSRELL